MGCGSIELTIISIGVFAATAFLNHTHISLQVLSEKIGLAPYCEAAMFHKASGTLLVTDAVIFIPDSPPEASTQTLMAAAAVQKLPALYKQALPYSLLPHWPGGQSSLHAGCF